jgi:hypothetical protein
MPVTGKALPDARVELLRLLAARLERLSVDSIWARRASGLRGSLIKALDSVDAGGKYSTEHLDLLIERSFEILRNAAREIPDAEAQWRRLKGQ